MRVIVHPDPAALQEAAADHIEAVIGRSGEGRVTIGLAGGSTPRGVYESLGRRQLDWSSVDLWLSDERWVPHDDPDSNGRMAAEALGPDAADRLVRPHWSEHLEAGDAAVHYEAAIREMIGDGRPDLTLLGMGADGHTASLFPGTAALDEETRWFVANHVPHLDAWRLTATPPLLQASREVLVMVTGESKAATVGQVLESPTRVHPIQLLADATGEVVYHLDESAAAGLRTTTVERG